MFLFRQIGQHFSCGNFWYLASRRLRGRHSFLLHCFPIRLCSAQRLFTYTSISGYHIQFASQQRSDSISGGGGIFHTGVHGHGGRILGGQWARHHFFVKTERKTCVFMNEHDGYPFDIMPACGLSVEYLLLCGLLFAPFIVCLHVEGGTWPFLLVLPKGWILGLVTHWRLWRWECRTHVRKREKGNNKSI